MAARRSGIPVSRVDSRTEMSMPRRQSAADFLVSVWFLVVIGVAAGAVPVHWNSANAQGQIPPVSLSGVLANGKTVDTQIDRDGRLSSGRTLSDFRRLTRAARIYDSPGHRPVRILTLATGERIPVRLQKTFSFQTRGQGLANATLNQLSLAGQGVAVPGWAVAAVAGPVGSRDVIFGGWPMRDDFWSSREGTTAYVAIPGGDTIIVPMSGRLRCDLDPNLRTLVVEMTVAWPQSDGGSLDFLFTDPDTGVATGQDAATGIRLSLENDRIVINRLGSLRVAIDAQSVRRVEIGRESNLRLTIDRGVTLSLAGRVVVRGSRSPGGLSAIVLRSSKSDQVVGKNKASSKQRPMTIEEARSPVVLSCLVRTRAAADEAGEQAANDQVAVQTHEGDLYYGDTVRAGSRDVQLQTQFGPVSLGWDKVRQVALPRALSKEVPPISGDVCRVQLAPDSATTFFGPQPKCELTGAVRLTARSVEIQHSLLRAATGRAEDSPSPSRMRLPWASVQEIEPLFRGEYRLLDPGPQHLGNTTQRSFLHPKPDGTALALHFVLKGIPAGRVFLSLDAADLEPASPQTLRATPNLEELRRGFLTTNVLVNDVEAGTLNHHCEFLSPVGSPQRLRVPVPREALKRGLNLVELRQNPGRNGQAVYDDCELRRVAIEIEEAR
jgi:hypothetical protein